MPRRRRFTRYGLLSAIIGLMALIACYVFGLAGWQSSQHVRYDFNDLMVPRLLDIVIVLWLLWIGSSIGSFLNVVAWRMPRGESLNGRSHCPRCTSQLKARDNFPVFGWLALGGRCRTCRLPISPRYPIVEAAVGLSIAAVGVAELFRLALPYQTNHWHGGPLWTPIIDREMLMILLYHVVVLSTSWACGLIRYDNHRLPRGLILFGLATAIVPVLFYPPLAVVPWQFKSPESWGQMEGVATNGLMDATLRILSALVAAVFFARLISQRWLPSADLKLSPLGAQTAKLVDLIVIIGLPSVVLGWQSATCVLLLATVATALLRPIIGDTDVSQRFVIAMPIATTAQIVTWRIAQQTEYWASVDSTPIVMIATAMLVWLGATAQAGSRSHSSETQPDRDTTV